MNDSFLVHPDVDYTQVLPIQQKRIIAFINHFIMNTVSFVNTFAQSCESRLMEFEFKLQKVDASLKILESQLSSIALDENITESTDKNLPTEIMENQSEIPEIKESASNEEIPQNEAPKPNEDPRYSKYFKMVQVGVPIPAVKLKMQSEGLDPNILDKI